MAMERASLSNLKRLKLVQTGSFTALKIYFEIRSKIKKGTYKQHVKFKLCFSLLFLFSESSHILQHFLNATLRNHVKKKALLKSNLQTKNQGHPLIINFFTQLFFKVTINFSKMFHLLSSSKDNRGVLSFRMFVRVYIWLFPAKLPREKTFLRFDKIQQK